MKRSKLSAFLLAAGTVAVAQSAFAGGDLNVMHPYECRLVSTASPYREILGYFQSGHMVNATGSTVWVICPTNYEALNNYFAIYMSGTSQLCQWCTTSAQSGAQTCYSPSGSASTGSGAYYYYWNQDRGNIASEIQCQLANGASVFAYHTT